jgi:hypothetical protein
MSTDRFCAGTRRPHSRASTGFQTKTASSTPPGRPRLIGKVTKIGPHCAQLAREIFARLGRPGQHAIYGLSNLTRHHKRAAIEKACEQVLTLSTPSYQALKRILERHAATEAASAAAGRPSLQQSGPGICAIEEYQAFWEEYSRQPPTDPTPTNNR